MFTRISFRPNGGYTCSLVDRVSPSVNALPQVNVNALRYSWRNRVDVPSSYTGGREEGPVEGNPAIMRGTGQGLLEFCERLAARGDIDPATARAYRSTAKKILETESTDLNDVNLRELDVDDLFVRFTKLNKPAYSEGSLKTYRSRFNQAVGMYLAWLDDDRGWKTGGRPAPKTAANGSAGSARKTTSSRRAKTSTAQPVVLGRTAPYLRRSPSSRPHHSHDATHRPYGK